MNICVLYYDDFCEFEVALTYFEFLSENVFSVALEDKIYVSEEKQKFIPDKTIKELNPEEIDLFIIPGTDSDLKVQNNPILRDFLNNLKSKNKFIAGICGGVSLMARYGLLDNKKCTGSAEGIKPSHPKIHLYEKAIIVDEDVVVDGNIITSTGKAFVEFSIELGRIMGVYKNDDEVQTDYSYFKNVKE